MFVEDSYETKNLLLEWDHPHGIDREEELDLPQFRLTSQKTEAQAVVYKTGV